MRNILTIGSVAALLAFLLVAVDAARAQSFFDDFEDNNLTDGSPVTWDVTDSQGTINAVNGDMVLTPNVGGECCVDPTVEFPHGDVSIDAIFEFPARRDIFIGVKLRETDNGIADGYWVGAFGTGEIGIGYNDPRVTAIRGVFLPTGAVAAGTDVTFHAETIGNTITFTAWETLAGPDFSATVSWTDTDSLFPTGNLLLPFIEPNGHTDLVRVRSFGAAIIPEPSGLSLIGIASLFGTMIRRRFNSGQISKEQR